MSTVTLNDDAPVDPDDELLVAYIDGELDRDDQAELENRLLDDEHLRSRLQQLQTGWELLDDLPDPSPSLKLVESTLELVVDDVVKAKPPASSVWSRYRIPIAVTVCCLLGMVASFMIASTLRTRAYHHQLDDLAVAEYFDAYNRGGDLTLMRDLFANDDWRNMIAVARKLGDIEVESTVNLWATPLDEREALIESLPEEDRNALNANLEQFSRLDESERSRIRRTADAVAKQPDSESLLQTMQAYAIWRENLPPDLRDMIESKDEDLRSEAIAEAIEEGMTWVARMSPATLDDDTISVIYLALKDILQERLKHGDVATVRFYERLSERANDPSDAEFFAIRSIVVRRGPLIGGPSFGGPGGRRMPGGLGPAPLDHEELERIELALALSAEEAYEKLLSLGDPFYQSMALQLWAGQTVSYDSPIRKQESLTPLQRYEEYSPAEREWLDLLPPEDIKSRLWSQPRRPFPR